MADLTGKIAIVTGAKGGLGTSVTNAFLGAGATVVGVSRSISANDFDNTRFIAMPAELSSRAAAESVVEQVSARFGRIDVAVHLVGGWTGGVKLEETDSELLDRMLDLNLKSAFYFFGAAARGMRKQGSGRMLAIASKAAADPAPGSGAYSVSKAALVSLMRGFAAELRDSGVTANAVLPGTMDTPQNRAAMPGADPARWVDTVDVAELLVFLASDSAGAISGAAVPMYGADA